VDVARDSCRGRLRSPLPLAALASHENLSRLVDWATVAGFGLALLAVLISGAVLWLRPGIDPAPRLARWALTVGALGLGLYAAGLLVAFASLLGWGRPAW
jgi:hypothetical protein